MATEKAKTKAVRIPSFIDVPYSEEAQVPLSPPDFTNKTHVMLRVLRERDNLEAEFESAKAAYKQRLKNKQEEITELEGELQSGTEKRKVALIARFFPKKKLKRILDAGTKKKLRDDPMTPAEVRQHSQPTLFTIPAVAAAEPVSEPAGDPKADGDQQLAGDVLTGDVEN